MNYAWFIPILPALGFALNMLMGERLGKRGGAYASILLLGISLLLASILLIQVRVAAPRWDNSVLISIAEQEKALETLERELANTTATLTDQRTALEDEIHLLEESLHELEHEAVTKEASENFPFSSEISYLQAGDEQLTLGLYVDPLAALMIFMVTLVTLLIHIFAVEYMAGEERYAVFFAYISLFSAAMLAMLMSQNLFHILLFWELMGVMSYLLIGFFYKKVAAQQAMKKAFMVTKVADLGLLIGILWIYQAFGTLDIVEVWARIPEVLVAGSGTATGIGLLFFLGAMGKSAQFPLHVWLLDAMEGPTPVSAMIHAATMVAAGVYVMARMYPLLEQGNTLPLIAFVGALTALFAAALAPAFTDIKKILAWSTVSQLGFMFLGLGVFGWVAAVFHLLTHAFFKALLFLCSGSMIHGSHTQDIFEMDKLKRSMPSTRWTFVIGSLSLAGIVPFAGFWSKDEILLAARHATTSGGFYWLPYVMALAASFLTAFYITRAYLIAFERERTASPWQAASWNQGDLGVLNMTAEEVKADAAFEHQPEDARVHESGPHITLTLWALAGSATVFGLLGSPLLGNALQTFVYEGEVPHLESLAAQWPGFLLGTMIAIGGIGLAWILYADGTRMSAPQALTRVLQRRLYLDDIYYHMIAKPLTRLRNPVAWIDRRLVDGLVDLLAFVTAVLGDALRRMQTGRLEHYAWTLAVGMVVLMLVLGLGGLG